LTPEALTRISSSPAPARGAARSAGTSTSGAPGSRMMMHFMVKLASGTRLDCASSYHII
jgi:hypothetical protein